jgi:hypothetical protein
MENEKKLRFWPWNNEFGWQKCRHSPAILGTALHGVDLDAGCVNLVFNLWWVLLDQKMTKTVDRPSESNIIFGCKIFLLFLSGPFCPHGWRRWKYTDIQDRCQVSWPRTKMLP